MDQSSVTNAERDALLAEIHAAFKDVRREGGVSWTQAYIHDVDYIERADVPDDPDRHWSELLDDKEWRIDPGLGGFSFLDPIGFRYYLPAAMCRAIAGKEGGFCFHLTLAKPDPDGLNPWLLEKWSLLDPRQCRAVAAYLALMHRLQPWANDGPPFGSKSSTDRGNRARYPYAYALEQYWGRHLDAGARVWY